MIEIYGKDHCPYCDRAIALVEKIEAEFVYKKLDRDFTREQLIEQFPNAKTFPQIIISFFAAMRTKVYASFSVIGFNHDARVTVFAL